VGKPRLGQTTRSCDYPLPGGPTIHLTDIGTRYAAFSINSKGTTSDRYEVAFSRAHGRIIVSDRKARLFDNPDPYAFISLENGLVYDKYPDCAESYRGRPR